MITNDMISILSATNRNESNTHQFAIALSKLLRSWNIPSQILDLKELHGIPIQNDMYDSTRQHPIVRKLQDEYILPVNKFIFLIPEYNGSYPGLLKYFIDACSIREYERNFTNKKAFLIGISSGRAGNLRGLEHLTGVLHYLKTFVYPVKIPVSQVESILDIEHQKITNQELVDTLRTEICQFAQKPITQP